MNQLPEQKELPEKIKQAHQKLLECELKIEATNAEIQSCEYMTAALVAAEEDATGKKKYTNEIARKSEVDKRLNDNKDVDRMSILLDSLKETRNVFTVEYEYLRNCLKVYTNLANEDER